MRSLGSWLLVLGGAYGAVAGERVIDFNKFTPDQPPAGFVSTLTGNGELGHWKVIADPTPSPATGTNQTAGPQRVLAQLSQDGTDERFPLLIFDEANYGDFVLTTRFKTVDG